MPYNTPIQELIGMYIWFTMHRICVNTCGTDAAGIRWVASRHLSTCVYKPFIVQGLSTSTVHICIIRLLLKPRDLQEDGGMEARVKVCENVGQVVDTHQLSMLPAISKMPNSRQHRWLVCINHLTNVFACFHSCFHTPNSRQHRQLVCINHLANVFAHFHSCFHTPTYL